MTTQNGVTAAHEPHKLKAGWFDSPFCDRYTFIGLWIAVVLALLLTLELSVRSSLRKSSKGGKDDLR